MDRLDQGRGSFPELSTISSHKKISGAAAPEIFLWSRLCRVQLKAGDPRLQDRADELHIAGHAPGLEGTFQPHAPHLGQESVLMPVKHILVDGNARAGLPDLPLQDAFLP